MNLIFLLPQILGKGRRNLKIWCMQLSFFEKVIQMHVVSQKPMPLLIFQDLLLLNFFLYQFDD